MCAVTLAVPLGSIIRLSLPDTPVLVSRIVQLSTVMLFAVPLEFLTLKLSSIPPLIVSLEKE